MIHWNYNADDYRESNTNLLEEGNYRVRIINAVEIVSRYGTKGLEISLEVNGHSNKLKHFIWYNHDYEARTNQLLGEFFNSFNILETERDRVEPWIGKIGAVYVMHDEYKGRTIAKVGFCIPCKFQQDIPAWEDNPPNNKMNLGEHISSPMANTTPPGRYSSLAF